MLQEPFTYCLAPMDNLSHYVFRRMIASTLPSEIRMTFFSPAINPNGVLHGNPGIKETLPVNPGEILYYNIRHGDPDIIIMGIEKMLKNNPAGFNLNCGCPRAKVLKANKVPVGAALMDYPELVWSKNKRVTLTKQRLIDSSFIVFPMFVLILIIFTIIYE